MNMYVGSFPFALSVLEQTISKPSFALEYKCSAKDFTRERCLNFKAAFLAVLSSQKRSLHTELSTFLIDAAGKVPHFSPQAFSKARYKIKPGAFYKAMRLTAWAATVNRVLKTFHGYRVCAVDGTSLLLPDSRENREVFGACGNASKTYASASASILYDVLNDIVLDAVIGKQFASEREDCRIMLGRTGRGLAGAKPLAIMDRGYGSRPLYRFLEKHGYKYIIRIPLGESTPKAVREMEGDDCVITDAREPDIVQRAIKVGLPSGETEVLVTNLFDKGLSTKDFLYLYHLRWGIEGKYLEVKHKEALEKFTGYRPDGIRQDFYCAMAIANLASLLRAGAEMLRVSRPGTKWGYQASVMASVNVLRSCLVRLMYHPEKRERLAGMMMEALKDKRSAKRPGRHAERKRPRTVKRHNLNLK